MHVRACAQHALPWELNKLSLDTLGESDLGLGSGGMGLAATRSLAGRFKVLHEGEGRFHV
jgi:hypothetical protein